MKNTVSLNKTTFPTTSTNCTFLVAKNISDSSIDYPCDTTTELFIDVWFQIKLLPNISPDINILMDNVSYQSRHFNNIPVPPAETNRSYV